MLKTIIMRSGLSMVQRMPRTERLYRTLRSRSTRLPSSVRYATISRAECRTKEVTRRVASRGPRDAQATHAHRPGGVRYGAGGGDPPTVTVAAAPPPELDAA